MPRKKTETSAPPALETITLSVEVSKSLFEQICAAAKYCGFDSIDEWLLEAITNEVRGNLWTIFWKN